VRGGGISFTQSFFLLTILGLHHAQQSICDALLKVVFNLHVSIRYCIRGFNNYHPVITSITSLQPRRPFREGSGIRRSRPPSIQFTIFTSTKYLEYYASIESGHLFMTVYKAPGNMHILPVSISPLCPLPDIFNRLQ
jgi:hypothetical protein